MLGQIYKNKQLSKKTISARLFSLENCAYLLRQDATCCCLGQLGSKSAVFGLVQKIWSKILHESEAFEGFKGENGLADSTPEINTEN